MTGLTYPYTKYDRILGDNLADDLEMNPAATPPAGTAGGAGRYKYWVDTTVPANASLRQCVAERATAGFYIATEWLTWGTIDLAARKFHFNTDGVDFTGGSGPLVVHDLTVTGATNLNTLTVSGATTLGTLNAGATTLASLTVTGATALNNTGITGNLGVSGTITGGSLSISGAATLHDTTVLGNLTATGTITGSALSTGGNLNVSGAATINGGLTTGNLHVTGNSALDGTVTTGALTAVGLHVTGETDLDGSLNVDGATTLHGTNIAGDLSVTGAITGGSLNTAGALNAGAATLGSLHVTGATTLDGPLTVGSITGGLTVAGDIVANSLTATTFVQAENYRLTEGGTPYKFVDMGTDVGAVATLILGPEFASSSISRIALYDNGKTYYKADEHYFWSLTSSPLTFAVFNATGTFNASGSWNIICDDTIKENVTPYTSGLAELLQLNPVSYNYIRSEAGSLSPFATSGAPTRYGLMASNVQAVLPEMVTEMTFSAEGLPDTPLATIAPTHLVWILINACKELDARIKALELIKSEPTEPTQPAQQPA